MELAFGHKPENIKESLQPLAAAKQHSIMDTSEDVVFQALRRKMRALQHFNDMLAERKVQAAMSDAQKSGSVVKHEVGDTVEFWREPSLRWKTGWHGPAKIVDVTNPNCIN